MTDHSPRPKSKRGRKAFGVVAGGLLFMALATGGVVLWLDSAAGHKYVARKITDMEFANGLRVEVGSIDGDIYEEPVFRGVILRDRNGIFARIGQTQLSWNSWQLRSRHLDIEAVNLSAAELLRLPELASDEKSNSSVFVPEKIDVARFHVSDMLVTSPNGKTIMPTDMKGGAHIDHNRWRGNITVRTKAAGTGQPKDMIELRGNGDFAATDLVVGGQVDAAADGLVAAYTGKAVPVRATFENSDSLGPLDPIFD